MTGYVGGDLVGYEDGDQAAPTPWRPGPRHQRSRPEEETPASAPHVAIYNGSFVFAGVERGSRLSTASASVASPAYRLGNLAGAVRTASYGSKNRWIVYQKVNNPPVL